MWDCYGALLQSAAEFSDSVAAEWNQLADTYARGVHYNGLALKHARQGDLHTAAHIWLCASEQCFYNAKILFNLAVCYQNGLGITKDVWKVNCTDSLRNCDCFFSSPDWTYSITDLCVCVLTRLAQIITTKRRHLQSPVNNSSLKMQLRWTAC